MRPSKPLSWLLAALLLLASATALAASSDRGRGSATDDGGDDHGDDGADGNATASDSGRGRGAGTESDDGDRGLRDLGKAQREEREAFREAHEEDREACQAANRTERADCEQALAEDQRDFQREQREEFEQAREGLREARAADRLGRFALTNGTFTGTFVSFGWDPAVPALTDYTVGGCLVFTRVALLGAGGDAEVEFREHGRVLRAEAGDGKLQAHDNPGGVLAARAPDNGTVAFTLAPGIAGALNGSRLALTGCANWTASLGGHALAFANGTASVDRQATFVAHDDNPALPPAAARDRPAVERAKAERHIGAEVLVVGEGAEDVAEVELDEALDVSAEHEGAGGLRVVVNGTGTEPRTVVVNVAPGLLVGDHVLVRYFDEVNGTFADAAITRADSLEDVLDPTDDAGPEYWVEHGPDGTVAYVSIDHWSTHAFTVQGMLSEVPPSVALGLLGAVAFVAVAGAGLLRRPRRPSR